MWSYSQLTCLLKNVWFHNGHLIVKEQLKVFFAQSNEENNLFPNSSPDSLMKKNMELN